MGDPPNLYLLVYGAIPFGTMIFLDLPGYAYRRCGKDAGGEKSPELSRILFNDVRVKPVDRKR